MSTKTYLPIIYIVRMYKKNVTVEKTEGTIKNGKSRDTSIIEHTRQIWNSWRRKAPH
jgi:hypothetical protein